MFKLFLLGWPFLVAHALAQNNSSSNETCAAYVQEVKDDGFLYNSTGTIPVQFVGQDEPWHISVTLQDYRTNNNTSWAFGSRSMQWVNTWLSVPKSLGGTEKGNTTRVCAYMMGAVNATANNATDPDESCSGIISDECIKRFSKAMLTSGQCGRIDSSDECGSFILSQITPTNFSSSECALDELKNVDLPDDYITYGALPAGALRPGDDQLDSFEAYDLKVRQPIPLLFVAFSGGYGSAQMVCLAPNNVVDGSRIPQSEFLSGAVSITSGGWTGVLLAGIALFAAGFL